MFMVSSLSAKRLFLFRKLKLTSTSAQVIPSKYSKGEEAQFLEATSATVKKENTVQGPDWAGFWKIIAIGCQRRLEAEACTGGATNECKTGFETTSDNSRILSS